MSHAEIVEQARQKFSQAIVENGLSENEPIFESMLIHDGFYIGRRFRCGNLKGTWLFDSDELELAIHQPEYLPQEISEPQLDLKKAA